jgi:hypothetical protein
MDSVEAFLQQVETIPWFANLGKLAARDEEVFRIYHWHTWPGPTDPGSELQSAFHMHWRNDLFESPGPVQGMREAWQTIFDSALRLTKARVPYSDKQDAWFGPNAAAWQGAHVAALVGCTLLRDGGLKESPRKRVQWTLSNEWWWYCAGHWPCTYYWSWGRVDIATANRYGLAKSLVVY